MFDLVQYVETKSHHFYAPNFEKVGSILVSACPCVRPSVQKKIQAKVLKFHVWIPRQKIAYCIISSPEPKAHR